MKTNTRKPACKPTLQICEMIEITDPAEQAALDRRCQEAEKMLAQRDAPMQIIIPRRKCEITTTRVARPGAH